MVDSSKSSTATQASKRPLLTRGPDPDGELQAILANAFVPKWVKDEFRHHRHLLDYTRLPYLAKQPINLETTWAAIARHEPLFRAKYPRAEWHHSQLTALATYLDNAVRRYQGTARWTSKQREKHGRDLGKLIGRLRLALDAVEAPESDWDWMGSHTYDRAQVRRCLDQVEAAANAFAAKPAPIAKPTQKGAARTFFIRSLSHNFNFRYNDPLPEVVLELATFLFPQLPEIESADIHGRIKDPASRRKSKIKPTPRQKASKSTPETKRAK